jgi:hypothetical protein
MSGVLSWATRTVCAAASVGLVSMALLSPALGFAAPSPGGQGLQGGWSVGDSGILSFPHSLSSQLPIMRAAGAGWVRINFRLGTCYQTWTDPVTQADVDPGGCDAFVVGKTALQAYDSVVDAARANNLQVLGLLGAESWHGSQDEWQSNNAETASGNGNNVYIGAFARNAGQLAAHFAGRVNNWEIWNEPNAWESYDDAGHIWGSSYIYPSNFAWLLQRSYRAIKEANRRAVVVAGAVVGFGDTGASTTVVIKDGTPQRVTRRGTTPPTARRAPGAVACTSSVPSGAGYVCDTYRVGLARADWKRPYPFDEIGQHFYIDQAGATTAATVSSYLEDVHKAVLAYEGSRSEKRTVVTEFGWVADYRSATYGADQARQAQNLRTTYTVLRATPYVTRGYWFSVQDVEEGNVFYGLVENNYATSGPNLTRAKPAFLAYQEAAR